MPIVVHRSPDQSFLVESFHGAVDLALLQSLMRWLEHVPALEQSRQTLLDLREADLDLNADTVRILAGDHRRVLESRGRRRIALLVDRPESTAFAMLWRRHLPAHVSVPEVYCSLKGALGYLGLKLADFDEVRRGEPGAVFESPAGASAPDLPQPVQAAG